jgi:hypothetical protein
MESLEGRRLLSHGHGGRELSSLEFDQLAQPLQTALNSLATSDNLTAPTSTQKVYLGNRRGQETYTIYLDGTGTQSALTVNAAGQAVTAPTRSTTTFSTIDGAAAGDEFTTLANTLGLTAPADTDNVNVSTTSGGVVTYTMHLAAPSGTTGRLRRGLTVSVDANGDPVGTIVLPLSVFSTAIQNGLTGAAPTGATALTSTSNVIVKTVDGVTLYSARYTGTGTVTTVTVDSTGTLTSLPSRSKTTWASVPPAAQAELQALATDEGATLDTTGTVYVYDEANGTVIYSMKVSASKTGSSGNTFTYMLTVSSDQDGNPTVPPGDGGFGGGGCGGGGDGFDPGGPNDPVGGGNGGSVGSSLRRHRRG